MQVMPRAPDIGAGPGRSAGLDRPAAVLACTVLGLGLVHLWLAGAVGLTDDEAYYRLWALAPAMGYLDHPPMVGWMIAAGRWIAGDTALGIRLGAVLVALIGPLVLWRTAFLLFGASIARAAVWIALAMPLLAVGGVVITPDTPSVLFWGLAGWALAELHASRGANWWLAVGAFAGLGLLSKYTNLFVGAGILLWLVLLRANWPWFRAWQLWAGGAIACVLALPVVLWNAEHEWASFAKQFGRVGHGHGLTGSYLLELAGANLGLMSPLIAVLAAIGLAKAVRTAAAARDQASALVAAGVLPFLAYLLVHALHDRVQANWMAPLYPAFAICAALALGGPGTPGPGPALGRLGRWAVAVGFASCALLYWHAVRPLVDVPGQRDPLSQTRGWSELAAEVERLRIAKGACWVATSSYATTGQLAWHLEGKAPVVQLDERIRYVHLPAVDAATLACPALYVELERRSAPALLEQRFAAVERLESLTRSHRAVPIASYTVYLVGGPKPDSGAGPLLR